jgi:hypothetical protein
LAVIVGIVFLAVEVKDAGNATRQQTETARVEGYNALNLTLASDASLSKIFVIGLDDPARLNSTEAAQMYSTAGGREFLKTNAYGSLAFLAAIEPYMGQELRIQPVVRPWRGPSGCARRRSGRTFEP